MTNKHTSSSRAGAAAWVLVLAVLSACTPTAEATTAPPAEPVPTRSVTTSENGHSLTLVWQSEFSPQAALGAAVDVAVDNQGNVFVTTAFVTKFDRDGKFVSRWGGLGTGEGEFHVPTCLTTDAQGNVYVNDFRNKRIQKFDNDGAFLLQFPPNPPGMPGSIAADQKGNVYVSLFETEEDNLQKFDSEGNFVRSWGTFGSGDGQFKTRIEDIAVDWAGNVYATDPLNHRVQKFDPDGNFLAAFGGEESTAGDGRFQLPKGITVDPQGNLYILDTHFLQKLAPDGSFIAAWPTTQGGELDRAGFLTVDADNALYVLARSEVVAGDGEPASVLFVKKFSQQ